MSLNGKAWGGIVEVEFGRFHWLALRDLLDKNQPENRPTVFYRGDDVYDRPKVGFPSNVMEKNGVDFSGTTLRCQAMPTGAIFTEIRLRLATRTRLWSS